MPRKIASLFTLGAFLLASASCTTMRTKDLTPALGPPGPKAKVTNVITVTGERIAFSPRDPGRVRGDAITGTASVRYNVPVEIRGPFSSIKRRTDGSVYEITDGGGRVHPVVRVAKQGEDQWTILVNDTTAQQVSVPLSDVRQISFKKKNGVLTALAIVSLVFAGVCGLTLALADTMY